MVWKQGITVLLAAAAVIASASVPPRATAAPAGVQKARATVVTESPTGVYIAVMDLQPAIAYDGRVAGYAATKPGKGQKINPQSAQVRKYAGLLGQRQTKALAAVGVSSGAKLHSYTMALNGVAARLTLAQANELARQPGVTAVLPDQWRFATTDSSPTYLGLTDLGSAYAKEFNGKGVVVGVIDTGIWPEHPSFADDGTLPAPPVGPLPCEFGNTAHNPNDAPFACNRKLIGARQVLATYRAVIGAASDEFDSARDDNGHGTHTASTAAGNAGVSASMYGQAVGTISGIAPRAHVIAYKGLGNLGGFTSDLAAAIDQAVADGVDVINYSIGGGAGLPTADELAFLFAADAGVFVATSAGNSGPGAGTAGNPGLMPWLTTVGASTQGRFFQGTVTLGNGASYSGASLTPGIVGAQPLVDAASAGGDLCQPGSLNPAVVSGKIVLCRRGVVARAAKSQAVQQAGGVGMILYENGDAGDLFTDSHWVPSVHVDRTPGLAIKAYIAADPNPTASLVTGQTATWPYAPSMTSFSSRGPNVVAPDIIKPDITAPGIQVLAGWSPFPDPGTLSGDLFAAIAGTSMSSPHVAGIYALLKQAHPEWSAAVAKSALMTTAHQDVLDNNRTSPADPFDMGAGHARPGGEWSKGSIAEPGLAYEAGLYDYLGFLCGMEWGVVTPAGCAAVEALGVPMEPYNLNYPSIGVAELAGSQTVRRTVTSVAKESGIRTYSVSVAAPPGYTVSVSPSTLRLKKGERATYSVTITNQSAPVGAWRFGSLTWREKDGNYSVRSPIAVRGALFEAPASVTGSGTSGATSFDVKFGYTGAYSAGAHGLVPATVIADTVVQDPDQSFSADDGYSDVHQFTLSGAPYFRVVLPAAATEADADLDLYVYDPGGSLVASSTGPAGTNEAVDVSFPANGTWRVYVHGWSTPGVQSDYSLYAWAVTGGSLSISAPTSATIGTTGTIHANWSGLGAGTWNLGAVSHTGSAGLMGLTLVEVDNR